MGCTILAFLYSGLGRAADYGEARRLYRLGCDAEAAMACGSGLPPLGRPVDVAEPRGSFRWAATAAMPGAAPISASSTSEGLGRPVDYAEAARLYQMGCDGGDAGGCTNLGVLHNARPRQAGRLRRGRAALSDGLRRRQCRGLHQSRRPPQPRPRQAGRLRRGRAALSDGLRRRQCPPGLHQSRRPPRAKASAGRSITQRPRGSISWAATAAMPWAAPISASSTAKASAGRSITQRPRGSIRWDATAAMPGAAQVDSQGLGRLKSSCSNGNVIWGGLSARIWRGDHLVEAASVRHGLRHGRRTCLYLRQRGSGGDGRRLAPQNGPSSRTPSELICA